MAQNEPKKHQSVNINSAIISLLVFISKKLNYYSRKIQQIPGASHSFLHFQYKVRNYYTYDNMEESLGKINKVCQRNMNV